MRAQPSVGTTQMPSQISQPGLLPGCSFTFGKNPPEDVPRPDEQAQPSMSATQTPYPAFQPGLLPDCSLTFGSLPAQSSHLQPLLGNPNPSFPAAWTARPMFGGGVPTDVAESTAGMRLTQPRPHSKRAREPAMVRGGSQIPPAESHVPLFTFGSTAGPTGECTCLIDNLFPNCQGK